MKFIEVSNLRKKFGRNKVLDGISFSVKKGDFVVIFGPSGCGKTTLIKILSGLIACEGDVDVGSKRIGVVFQEPRLFPWLSVEDNIKFGLELQNKKQPQKDIDRVIDALEISNFKDDYPDQLSGGMKQKVALARVLVTKPDVIVLDEPFASLDVVTRKKLQDELLKIHKRKATMIFVTHNIEEALRLGKKIIVLSNKPTKVKGFLTGKNRSKKRMLDLMR